MKKIKILIYDSGIYSHLLLKELNISVGFIKNIISLRQWKSAAFCFIAN